MRSSSSFVLRYDNELAMRLLAEKIAAFRHPRTTIPEPINRAEHQSVAGVEKEYSSCNTSTEIGHSNQDRRGRCAWTRTFPVVVETRCMATQSIPASESQRRNPLENQDRYVLQESFAFFHGSVHDKIADCSSWFAEEIGCAVDERNLGWTTR